MNGTFQSTRKFLAGMLLSQTPVHTGDWHSVDVSKSPAHATYEMMNETITYRVPSTVDSLQQEIRPNLPWAEDHFKERVSGSPLNPPPSHENWPFGNTRRHMGEHREAFSHTYPERFWPRYANHTGMEYRNAWTMGDGHHGIRYRYGDLSDLVTLIADKPLTRQAYLPVWFPEDTGAHHGERVPCSLGYHFIVRNGQLHCTYSLRSCEFVRHLNDDIYMAARLVQWVAEEVNMLTIGMTVPDGLGGETKPPITTPGKLTVHITSLHALVGDRDKLVNVCTGVPA